jgi:hypothetical protein
MANEKWLMRVRCIVGLALGSHEVITTAGERAAHVVGRSRLSIPRSFLAGAPGHGVQKSGQDKENGEGPDEFSDRAIFKVRPDAKDHERREGDADADEQQGRKNKHSSKSGHGHWIVGSAESGVKRQRPASALRHARAFVRSSIRPENGRSLITAAPADPGHGGLRSKLQLGKKLSP